MNPDPLVVILIGLTAALTSVVAIRGAVHGFPNSAQFTAAALMWACLIMVLV